AEHGAHAAHPAAYRPHRGADGGNPQPDLFGKTLTGRGTGSPARRPGSLRVDGITAPSHRQAAGASGCPGADPAAGAGLAAAAGRPVAAGPADERPAVAAAPPPAAHAP